MRARWHVLTAGFLCYGFDAMDFMMLALTLAAITAEFHLTLPQAGLLGTAGMIGVGLSSLLFGWYADNYGRRRALLVSVTVFALFTAAVFEARGFWDVMMLRFAPGLRRNTLLGTLAAACALTGYWGVNTWLPTYLVRERGLDAASMATFVIALNVGMFVGYQLFGLLADRLGLRRSLLCCFVGATLLLPVYASIHDPRWLFWSGPLLGLFFAYTAPFGAYFPQLYPTRVRSLGAGFCFNVGRGVAAFAPYAFGELANHIGLAAGIGWCAVGFLLAGVVMALMPEVH